MVKTRSKPSISVFHNKHKDYSLDENKLPTQLNVKASEKTKRPADGSTENVPSRKRAAFGDITNATFNQPDEGGKDKQTKNSFVLKDTETRQGRMKTKTKAKQYRRSKEKDSTIKDRKPLVSEVKSQPSSPSGDILGCAYWSEESSLSQDILQISASTTCDGLDSTRTQSACDSASTSLKEPPSCKNDRSEVEQHFNNDDGKSAVDAVIDIDADASDPVTVSDYANEIFANMKTREERFPLTNYLEKQQDITAQMRAILVDWLVEVQECFELYHETLYLGVKLLDHFLERNTVKRDELQLVGATTLLISSKIEERHPPCMDDLIYICDDAYKQQQFIAMETKIMSSLGFDINIPIPYRFLRRYAKAAFVSIETLTLARYLLESSLLECQFISKRASLMASSCLYLAMIMKNCGEWTATLVHYTGYSKDKLCECVLQLNAMNSAPANNNLMTVKNKYSHKVFHEVATIPPLDSLTIQI
ncbi:G2/mitotic-specific cyclin-B3-like isoform X2 [Stylophora pistillata]|uniref:G2/mitotic-specific cyclin-B3-like isoform X2 n=1 Tax=Stylophora pistillata TaxID=50429 RepID=UPI000C04F2E5|nr:G2/mitotic-specific cyclin-B3-like isoform X2 [Stylophora pistillata]